MKPRGVKNVVRVPEASREDFGFKADVNCHSTVRPRCPHVRPSVPPSVRAAAPAMYCCTPREFHMFEERRIARGRTDGVDSATAAAVHCTCGFGAQGAFIGSSLRSFFLLSWQQQWPAVVLFASARKVGSERTLALNENMQI